MKWLLILMMCLTLGLAPFFPEPHLVGKVRWVMGGAKGMGLADWGDLVMHGLPFLWLGFEGVRAIVQTILKGRSDGS